MSDEHCLFEAEMVLKLNYHIKSDGSPWHAMSTKEQQDFFEYFLSGIGGMMCAYFGADESVKSLQFVADRIGRVGLARKSGAESAGIKEQQGENNGQT